MRFPSLIARDPARDEAFIAALNQEFPNVVNRQFLPVEAPPAAPHLTLADASSQLLLSAAQVDIQVRPFGENSQDLEQGLAHVERKMLATLAGLQALNVVPSSVGLIGTINFPFPVDGHPAEHVLKTHLRSDVDPADLQDASARIALKIRDIYFVTLAVSNYEVRVFERVLGPGPQAIRLKPGDGQIDEIGLELSIDINNNLEAQNSDADPVVTDEGVKAVVGLLRGIAGSAGPEFVETGQVSIASLTDSSTASAS